MRDKTVEAGLPPERVVVKPHFVLDPAGHERRPGRRGSRFLYVGRLTEEKGVGLLLAGWRDASLPPLDIVGDGPLLAAAEHASLSQPALRPLGRLTRSAVLERMAAARAVIVPSTSYETFGLTVIEAFASGTPVIAARIGALAELVEDGRTGLLFPPGDAEALAAKVHWAQSHPEALRSMGVAARAEYEAHYTPERNLSQLTAVYAAAVRSQLEAAVRG